MELTQQQYDKIKDIFPKQRGNVEINNLTMVNALLYVAENGCKWRALPKEFGKWHTVYVRMRRWTENGVIYRIFEALQSELLLKIDVSVLSLDSSCIKVHPDATGALKKTENKRSAKHAAAKIRKFT